MAPQQQSKEPEILPALDHTKFENKTFTPITIDDNDRTTTIQDLEVLNTMLECTCQALPQTRTIAGLIYLSGNAMKLIECRRKVKKLPYGASKTITQKGRTIEVLSDD